ncbi:MAG TPA: amidohydrolase family protein, partial [Gaiellaceae bacterium]|nr:amidohydrolase family protein [Gaiellaceae bacterium]
MILENGVIRTMDPQLPTARALALAGPYVAGGVGVHETALASPETVDLGGRCVLPAFTDSHVHFPTWSLAQRQVKLDGCGSLEEALARVRAAEVKEGRWLRGYGWRDGDWSPRTQPTKETLDAITGDTPAILISKDYHSAWLNSAAQASAAANS